MNRTWGNVYHNALRRGYDNGYAAWLADKWEKRRNMKTLVAGDTCPYCHKGTMERAGEGLRCSKCGEWWYYGHED